MLNSFYFVNLPVLSIVTQWAHVSSVTACEITQVLVTVPAWHSYCVNAILAVNRSNLPHVSLKGSFITVIIYGIVARTRPIAGTSSSDISNIANKAIS